MSPTEKERIVQKNVLQIFKENFNVSKSDDEILDIKPDQELEGNDTCYYEAILDIFLIEPEHLDSIKGKVKDTIKMVAKLWTINLHYALP